MDMDTVIFVLLLMAFIVAGSVAVWAAAVSLLGESNLLRMLYIIALVVTAIGAFLATFSYEYYANPNTCFKGWPVPYIIFQRENADSPWLDFIGPTVLLACPLNFIIYLFLPSLAFLIANYVRRRAAKKTLANNS